MERVKELNCLYRILKLSEKPSILIEELIQGIVDLIPPAWQFPHLTCARIIFNNNEYKTKNFRETKWKISSSTQINDKLTVIDICYFEDRLFLQEEKTLLTDITSHLKIILEKKEHKRMEVALQRSEQQYRTTLNSLNEAIHVIDRDRRIVLINPAFEQWIKDLNIEMDLIGREIFEVLYFLPESIREEYRQVFETGEPLITMENVKVKGKEYFTEVKKIPIFFEEKVAQVITIIRDITERKIAEQKLKESEEKYRHLFENSPYSILLLNTKGTILDCNSTTEKMFGYKKDYFIGKNYLKLPAIPSEFLPLLKKREEQLFKRNISKTIEFQVNKKDKNKIWVQSHSSLVKFDKNNLIQIIIQDISERKQIEETLRDSERKLMEIIEFSPDPTFVIDLKGKVIIWNQAIEELTGVNPKEMLGKEDYEYALPFYGVRRPIMINMALLPDEEIEKYYPFIEKDNNTFITEIYVESFKGGTYLWAKAKRLYDSHGNIVGAIESIRDITKRKRAAEVIKASEKKYREAYNLAEIYKDLFVHDVNNVFQNILSSSELGSMYIDNPEDQEQLKEIMYNIKDQVKRGANLISKVRKLSEMEKSQMPIQPIEVCAILKRTITTVKKNYQDKDINIQVDSIKNKLVVQGNNLLEDIFRNILINAVNYNDNPTVEILIRNSIVKKEGIKNLKIEFIDNGIGVTEDRKKIIFKSGYKKEKGEKGMGLGLSLAKKIVKNYNGKIWVEDRVKGDYTKGSNFVIMIPIAM